MPFSNFVECEKEDGSFASMKQEKNEIANRDGLKNKGILDEYCIIVHIKLLFLVEKELFY